MARLIKDERAHADYFRFHCPGCDRSHVFTIAKIPGASPSWTFDGDMDHPTVDPSIRVCGTVHITDVERDQIMRGEPFKPVDFVCHSFIRRGRIEFLSDCTHALAGQTVDLPNIES